MNDEKEIERIKEQSRQLASNNTKPLPLPFDEWEDILSRYLPRFKSYKYFKTLRIVLLYSGAIIIFLSLGLITVGNALLGIDFLLALFVGIIFIPLGLVCLSFILIITFINDLQENADRQSILMTMIYKRLSEKVKDHEQKI